MKTYGHNIMCCPLLAFVNLSVRLQTRVILGDFWSQAMLSKQKVSSMQHGLIWHNTLNDSIPLLNMDSDSSRQLAVRTWNLSETTSANACQIRTLHYISYPLQSLICNLSGRVDCKRVNTCIFTAYSRVSTRLVLGRLQL